MDGAGAALATGGRPKHRTLDRAASGRRDPSLALVGLAFFGLLVMTRPGVWPESVGRSELLEPDGSARLAPAPVRLSSLERRVVRPAVATLGPPPSPVALPPTPVPLPRPPLNADAEPGVGAEDDRAYAAEDDRAYALAWGSLAGAVALLTAWLIRGRGPRRNAACRAPALAGLALAFLVALTLTACGGAPSGAPDPPQRPGEYLDNALDWIEEHAIARDRASWLALRRDALALDPAPRTTAETYPAIQLALHGLGDPAAFFLEPGEFDRLIGLGVTALYPQGTVVFVEPDSPAARAGVREGDVVTAINGQSPQPQGGAPPATYPGTSFVDPGRTGSSGCCCGGVARSRRSR